MQILKLTNLKKRFGSNEVLRGINLQANRGDVISIIGSSGSGKSTMLRCINFLENANHGEINVCGLKIDCSRDPIENPNKPNKLFLFS